MEIPDELRLPPPGPTLDWVAGAIGPGASVTDVRRLANAWAAAVHAIDVRDCDGNQNELVLRRWARADRPQHAGAVEHEATVLSMLDAVPGARAPRLVATDPAALRTDAPALVMTRLRGHPVFSPSDVAGFVEGLATSLQAIHSAPLPPQANELEPYRPWGLQRPSVPPPWTRHPDVWRRAFEIARRPVPAYASVLCHRDFHPGNVLWHDGAVSGIVDWTHTCSGPAAADVAHCRLNLTVLFDLDAADAFSRRYGPVDDLAWFDIADVAGFGELDAWRWHEAGRTDITDESVARAFDRFVVDAVERIS
jgi:aminoglycoside phosphotransferase (APT) family kinase protein